MISSSDKTILREVAKRKLEVANSPINLEKRSLWIDMHGGRQTRPMVLAEWPAIVDEKKPFDPTLTCEGKIARNHERSMKEEIWVHEVLGDDHVVEPYCNVGWRVHTTDYGVQAKEERSADFEGMGSKHWDPPIKDIGEDFHKLKSRTFSVDREGTLGHVEEIKDAIGDILPVRIRSGYWWTMGLTLDAIFLIGLENLMLYMCMDPDGLHRIMAFLRDEHLKFALWLENEELLNLNNDNDYTGSGTLGYTPRLPSKDWEEGKPVRLKDQWVLLESQETVGVGPEQYAEFVFPYEKPIAEKFGAVYYGCCEPMHTRWGVVKNLPNLQAVSVAPKCDQKIMAEALNGQFVFSRKPNPTLISTAHFDEDLIRADIKATLDVTKKNGCRTEIIMKDVHTLYNQPGRLARWVELTREEVAKAW